MNADLFNLLIAFWEGFVLILSPCILAILPVFLANALSGSRLRLLGIITGFALTFTLLAFFARNLVQYSGIDLNVLRYLAYGVLFLLGFTLLSNFLTQQFNRALQSVISRLPSNSSMNSLSGGFLNGLLIGGVVAIVWTPCAGPVLAAVLVQIAIQKTTFLSFFTLLSFALGVAFPILVVALCGLKIRDSFQFFKHHASLFRKALGGIIIANLGYMYYQEAYYIPTIAPQTGIRTALFLEKGLWRPYKAPAIGGISSWLNSKPLQLESLQGKVVLIDFWTYSCINCVRTIPYLNAWHSRYHDDGLVIIGIHTPEFDFEKNVNNVSLAVKRLGISYPVALDNEYTTWTNFSNHYWPAHYLINKQGKVVYEHFGEGEYDVTENNIRYLLGRDKVSMPITPHSDKYSPLQTPETYLGYARAEPTLSPALSRDSKVTYQYSPTIRLNAWELKGLWEAKEDKIVALNDNAALKIHFKARKVFLVMGVGQSKPIPIKILLNGVPIKKSSLVVDKHALYEVVALPQSSEGVLEIIPLKPGLELYAFTFGS